MPISDFLLLTLVALIWGINFVVIKHSLFYSGFLCVLALRFGLTSIVLSPWMLKAPKLPVIRLIIMCLLIGCIYFCLLLYGMHLMPATESIIIVQFQVPFSAILGAYILHEKMHKRAYLGILLAFVGMIVTIGLPHRQGEISGILLVLSAALTWAYANCYVKSLPKMSPQALNGFIALIALIPVVVLSLIFEPHSLSQSLSHPNLHFLYCILFMVLGSTITGYGIWFSMLNKHPVYKVAPFNLLTPVFGIIAAQIVVKESLATHTLIGALVCMLGLGLILHRPQGQQRTSLQADSADRNTDS